MSLVPIALALAVPALAASDGWPGWRGPSGNGVAAGAPPITWAEDSNVRWRTALPGKGSSSPIVWGDRVFLTSAVGTGRRAEAPPEEAPAGGRPRPPRDPREEQDFLVLALDRASGAIAWTTKVATAMPHQATHRDGSYASPTPVTDGERVYASFGSYGVHALDLSGTVLWRVDLGDMQVANEFGEGGSPVLCGGNVVIAWDHEGDSFLVALDAATGQERWRTPRPRGTGWTTPIVVRAEGREELVVGGARVIAYDPATGAERWHHGEPGRGGAIASPVAIDGIVVYAVGGRRKEARALVPPRAGSPAADPLRWSVAIDGPHVPSPLAYGGKVYLLEQNSGLLSVLDAGSGKVEHGPERLEGVADVYASPVAAQDRIYVAGRDGTVEVLSAWPEIATLSVNRLDDGFDASPAIAGDELFLRGRASLYCIAEE